MHDMKDDEPGIALARLHKTRERNKRAVDHALAHLEREGVKVPEATIAALYEDALWFAKTCPRLSAPFTSNSESSPRRVSHKGSSPAAIFWRTTGSSSPRPCRIAAAPGAFSSLRMPNSRWPVPI
jgi:hypothetical protein